MTIDTKLYFEDMIFKPRFRPPGSSRLFLDRVWDKVKEYTIVGLWMLVIHVTAAYNSSHKV